MNGVFAEIDRVRIAEAERAAERYRREMKPRGTRRYVSLRGYRQMLRLRPATHNF
ncbi:MAG: hypothetical protein QOI19_2552 [Thermoleophilaceae bacterium]|jgi:hypothetical protein|nr:hypothetical protein [Thermoleophilaceae bacterium]